MSGLRRLGLKVNLQHEDRREDRYDTIILDCAPTAESLRSGGVPGTLDGT